MTRRRALPLDPLPLSTGTLIALLSFEAVAGQLEAPQPQPHIVDGQPAGTCEWAAVPAFNSDQTGCSAVLIHPQMIATAGHCAYEVTSPSVRWGESAFEPAHIVDLETCWVAEGYATPMGIQPNDIAFCKLSTPLALPYVPPAFGCELEALTQGTEITVVGFGGPNSGTKASKVTQLWNDPSSPLALIGQPDAASACSGDSGGPALVQLDDGSWRVFAVSSGGPIPCGAPGLTQYAWMHDWIPWIEAESGLDLTPCHDPDGTWNPTLQCQDFADPLDPGNGDWEQWCDGAAVSGPSESCGPAGVDVVLADVTIAAPIDGSIYDSSVAALDIDVEVVDGTWPVVAVALSIDGEAIDVDMSFPWAFTGIDFPTGTWTLVAHAVDQSGNVIESEPVVIHVGEPDDETGDPGDPTGDTGEAGGPGLDENDGSCACSTRGGDGGVPSVLVLGLLLLARRRRSDKIRPLMIAAGLCTLVACTSREIDSEPQPAGFGPAASDSLVIACEKTCDQLSACVSEPYDTCTAECEDGLILGGVGSKHCVAEYTDFIACIGELPCNESFYDEIPGSPCEEVSLTYWECDLAHGLTCDGDNSIPESWICDAVPDCQDGADELEC